MSDYRFRVLIVAGVSSPEQAADDKYSIPQQLADARELCARRGWIVVREIVIPGRSRYLTLLEDLLAKSPEFREILKVVRSGEVDLVVVRHTDRLFRTQELQQQLAVIFRQHRVQVYAIASPREPVPPDQLHVRAIDKFLESLDGFRAEDEIEKFRDRVRGSMRRRVLERGLAANAHRPPFGYRWVGRGKPLEQVPEEVEWLRRMRDWRLQGLGWQGIAARLNAHGVRLHGRPWNRVAVRRALENRYYWGDATYGDTHTRGTHEPVFEEGDWAALRAVDEEMRDRHPQTQGARELSGLCRCAICGGPMSVHISSRRRPHHNQRLTLLCTRSAHRYDGRSDPSERHTNYHNAQAVVDHLIRRVMQELADPDAFIEMRRAQIGAVSAEMLAAIDAQLRERRSQWARWDEAYERGIIGPDELQAHRRRIHAAIEALRAERQQLEARQALAARLDATVHQLAERVRALPEMAPEERREVWVELIQAVWLTAGEEPRIEWR